MEPRGEFERQFLPLEADLYHAALALAGNPADALDLVQETAFRTLRAFSQFRPGTSFRAWVFTILRNVHIDGVRRKRYQPVALEDPPEGIAPTPPEDPADLERALPDDLLRAFRALNPAQQLLILLRDVHDLPYKEIAGILRCPLGSVMSGLHLARRRLREGLRGRTES